MFELKNFDISIFKGQNIISFKGNFKLSSQKTVDLLYRKGVAVELKIK